MPDAVDVVVEIVRLEVPVEPGVRLMLVGANVKLIPVAAGDTVADNATLPVNPMLLAVMVEIVELPEAIVGGLAALALNWKSGAIVTVAVAVWVVVPLTPLTVTV